MRSVKLRLSCECHYADLLEDEGNESAEICTLDKSREKRGLSVHFVRGRDVENAMPETLEGFPKIFAGASK